jgi:hypothetical protein
MAQDVVVETRRDRKELIADAGWRRISFGSVLAGTLVAYGAFAVLLAVAAAVVKALGVDTNLSSDEWRQLGVGGGIAVAVAQFLSYLSGGYVAGRMARRSGAMHGVLVFFLAVALAGVVAAVVSNQANVDVPARAREWRDIGTVAGIGSLVAMFLGSLIGGIKGERWHGKLVRRAYDPEVGDGVPMVLDRSEPPVAVSTATTLDEDYANETRSSRSSDQ